MNGTQTKPYGRLALMAVLHFSAMYILMYAMVDVFGNALPNLNQLYMAALMTSPMILIELWLMGAMYPNRILNAALLLIGAVGLSGTFLLIRSQFGIGDTELLESMIPHHAGAVLMCEEATVTDPQIQQLCTNIISGQQAEIEWMKLKLESLRP